MISAKVVKELREMNWAGFMVCLNALTNSYGEIEQAG